MRILILDEEFPFPANTGKRTRSFNLYRRLAARFRIRYVGYGETGAIAEAALREHGIETVAVPPQVPHKEGAAFYLRLAANLFSRFPYIVSSHYSSAYLDVVREQMSEFAPALVLCEWTPYALYAKDLPSVKRMVSAHNVEADIWQRYFENEASPPRRWYIREQWRKVARFERSALNWVDALVAVSEPDRIRLAQQKASLHTRVIANGVDLEYFRPLAQPVSRQHLVFTGSMDWRPNQDAARYFAREILPLLRRVRPELECTFVGRSPPPDIQTLAKFPGFNLTGTVDDVRPYVERAAVYVVPLRIGGGSRLKILEALAMGRPVVSTTVGAEGLDVINERDLLLADDPASFAQAVLRALDDSDLCDRLVVQGRQLVEQNYGWDALAERFARFICEVVGSPAMLGKSEEMPI